MKESRGPVTQKQIEDDQRPKIKRYKVSKKILQECGEHIPSEEVANSLRDLRGADEEPDSDVEVEEELLAEGCVNGPYAIITYLKGGAMKDSMLAFNSLEFDHVVLFNLESNNLF